MFSTGKRTTFEDIKTRVNSIDQSVADATDLFTRSNEPETPLGLEEPPNPVAKVDAKLQTDYDFHGFDKEDEDDDDDVNDKDDKNDDDYDDEDNELLYGDIQGTNETMGEKTSSNQTTGSNVIDNNLTHSSQVQETIPGNSDTTPSNGQVETTPAIPPKSISSKVNNENELTPHNLDKNQGNINVDVGGNENIPEATPEGVASEPNKIQENSNEDRVENPVGQSTGFEQSSNENNPSVNGGNNEQSLSTNQPQDTGLNKANNEKETNTGPLFRNPQQSSSENTLPGEENNGENNNEAFATNQEGGSDLNSGNNERSQDTGHMFSNPDESSSENNGDNIKNQGEDLNKQDTDSSLTIPSQENNNEQGVGIQTGLGNTIQGTDVSGNFNPENKQEHFATQNGKDRMSKTQTQSNIEEGNSVNINDNYNPVVSNNGGPENQGFNQNTNEDKQQEQQEALEATGKPEYITHAWGGDSTKENHKSSQSNDQGNVYSRHLFFILTLWLD